MGNLPSSICSSRTASLADSGGTRELGAAKAADREDIDPVMKLAARLLNGLQSTFTPPFRHTKPKGRALAVPAPVA
jgi:hypothetical protein